MVAASAYGIYSGYKTIKEANDNPNLTRNERLFQFGFGTGEILTSLLPVWGKFKGSMKGRTPEPTKPKPNYAN